MYTHTHTHIYTHTHTHKRATALRTSTNVHVRNDIYINPDLTQEQRSIQYKLRTELRLRKVAGELHLIIKNSSIVTRKPPRLQQVLHPIGLVHPLLLRPLLFHPLPAHDCQA